MNNSYAHTACFYVLLVSCYVDFCEIKTSHTSLVIKFSVVVLDLFSVVYCFYDDCATNRDPFIMYVCVYMSHYVPKQFVKQDVYELKAN